MEVATKRFRVDLTRRLVQEFDKRAELRQLRRGGFVIGAVGVRDSKDPTGPALVFTPDEWDAFVGDARTASSTSTCPT